MFGEAACLPWANDQSRDLESSRYDYSGWDDVDERVLRGDTDLGALPIHVD